MLQEMQNHHKKKNASARKLNVLTFEMEISYLFVCVKGSENRNKNEEKIKLRRIYREISATSGG